MSAGMQSLCTSTGHTGCQAGRADALTQRLSLQERRLRSENMRLRRELAQARAGKQSQASAIPTGGPPSPSASGAPLLPPARSLHMRPCSHKSSVPKVGWPVARAWDFQHFRAMCFCDASHSHLAAASSMPWSPLPVAAEHALMECCSGRAGPAGSRWQAAASVQEQAQLAPPLQIPDLNFTVVQLFCVGRALCCNVVRMPIHGEERHIRA